MNINQHYVNTMLACKIIVLSKKVLTTLLQMWWGWNPNALQSSTLLETSVPDESYLRKHWYWQCQKVTQVFCVKPHLVLPWKLYLSFSIQFPVLYPWLSTHLSEQQGWEKLFLESQQVSQYRYWSPAHSNYTWKKENLYLHFCIPYVFQIGLGKPLIKFTGEYSGFWESFIHLFIHLFWARI